MLYIENEKTKVIWFTPGKTKMARGGGAYGSSVPNPQSPPAQMEITSIT